MSFKTIETQEQLEEVLKERLERERKKYDGFVSPEDVQKIKDGYEEKIKNSKKYDGYTSPEELEKIKKDLKEKISNLTSENNKLKSTKLKSDIARKYNIPEGMISRLQGDTEEELSKDAEELSKFMSQGVVLPLGNQTTSSNEDLSAIESREAMRKLVQNLEEGE